VQESAAQSAAVLRIFELLRGRRDVLVVRGWRETWRCAGSRSIRRPASIRMSVYWSPVR
jgi:hypothetical protein